ncbi:MAG TPA: hypothetical protein PLT08_18210 [Anaerolineales bacterium]|nr:hypothetical protein [Anaerolineales bacterium]
MQNGVCPKCNSRVIIKNKPLLTKGDYDGIKYLFLMIVGKRTGWFFRKSTKGNLRAWVCGECGYTEIYTINFKEFLDADHELKT